jgi:acyl-CoA reductase-like NAD-dependent aldehyde dehydrogenase
VVSKCLLIQADAQLNTWRCSIAHGSCNYECKEASSARWTVIGSENGLYQCAHAFVHDRGRAQSDTMVAAVHRCCSVPPWRRTLPSSRIRILVRVWTGMRPDALVLSILSPEWEDKPSRETKVLYWNAVATLFRPLAEACKDSSMTRTTAWS